VAFIVPFLMALHCEDMSLGTGHRDKFFDEHEEKSRLNSDVKMSVFGRFVCLSSGEIGAGEPFTIGGRYILW
jgi:hypothetical protein